jgi:hypothetical protein
MRFANDKLKIVLVFAALKIRKASRRYVHIERFHWFPFKYTGADPGHSVSNRARTQLAVESWLKNSAIASLPGHFLPNPESQKAKTEQVQSLQIWE